MEKMNLPNLPMPFPHRYHPHFDHKNPETDRFERSTRSFIDKFHLYDSDNQRERMRKILSGKLAALIYPQGGDELLQVGSDALVWAFAFDDEYCDEGPISRNPSALAQKVIQIQHAFDAPETMMSDDRYALAMQDMRLRLGRYVSPVHIGRLAAALRTYMIAELWQVLNPKPTLSEYVLLRLYSGGSWFFPVLAPSIAGIELLPEEFEDRRTRALSEMMAVLLALDTDLFAYIKERDRSSWVEHNVIPVICREYSCSFERAVDHYLTMRIQLICLFQRIYRDFASTASPAQRALVETQILYCTGGQQWAQSTFRYSLSGLDISDDFVTGLFVDEMPEERLDSWGAPSAEWWWNYDPARSRSAGTQPDAMPAIEFPRAG